MHEEGGALQQVRVVTAVVGDFTTSARCFTAANPGVSDSCGPKNNSKQ
ncbi:hypothetical protein KP77_26810 [Jeotgalibacillus alimentarius]|uniref:Uncharacterized protein n=1 Tax=Jeotgalibacillus alimentarius TaxID=135826 RepID=A0A0C2RXS2_9BACL|nr:hypothetical protein KP77_26810 [Jeotgalibacillus alimentarius]